MSQTKAVIVALDYSDQNKALALVDKLDPEICRLKVGKEMFTLFGPELVKTLQRKGFDIFLDLKFHDIPNTVAKAVASAAELGVWMVNVHASGGLAMMQAAAKSLDSYANQRPILIAVTVLTSMTQEDLSLIGINRNIDEHVNALAQLSGKAGLDGVVCSAQETRALRNLMGKDFTLVTPGIRPAGSSVDDQKRVVTPSKALAMGSDYLVIGRPITQASDPLTAITEINRQIEHA